MRILVLLNVEKDRRQTVIAEGENFRPTKSYKFPKSKQGKIVIHLDAGKAQNLDTLNYG